MAVYKTCSTFEEKIHVYRQFLLYEADDPDADRLTAASILVVLGGPKTAKSLALKKTYPDLSPYSIIVQPQGEVPTVFRIGLGTKMIHHRIGRDAFVDALLAEHGDEVVVVEFV